MKVSCLPSESSNCGWLDHGTQLPSFERLSGLVSAPYVVVGAGFTGLAAARRIAELEPDKQILLVDAVPIGRGTAGRSSGFVVPIAHFARDRDCESSRRLYRLGCAGINCLRELVQRHSINCDWEETGRLIGARSRFGIRSLSHQRHVLTQLKSPFEELSGEQVAEQTGMSGYLAAIRQMDSVMVHPALLVAGLAANLPPNVRVLESSPIEQIQEGKKYQLRNQQGSIDADKVILTTNAYLNSFGLASNRAFPMRTFASTTLLPESDRAGFGREPWGLTSPERIGSSLRRISGDRILIRNTALFGYRGANTLDELHRIAKIHLRTLRDRYPNSPLWEIQSTWSGVLSVSANGAGIFGELKENLWAVAGHNGHGIAQGTIAGQLLADAMMDNPNPLLQDIQLLPQARWIPRGPLLRLGVGAMVRYWNWKCRQEI